MWLARLRDLLMERVKDREMIWRRWVSRGGGLGEGRGI